MKVVPSNFQILLHQVKQPNMVAMTIYGLKELLMQVPDPTGYQAFVGHLPDPRNTGMLSPGTAELTKRYHGKYLQ